MQTLKKCVMVLCVASLAFASTGCQTMSDHKIASGAVLGTLVGAAAGAVISDDSGKGALIGAAAGGLLGTGVGYYLNNQAKKLEAVEGVDVVHVPATQMEPEHLTLQMQASILFEVGSSALKQAGTMKVAEVSATLREYPNSTIIIKGYASSEGADDYNLALSKRRAEMVRNTMIGNHVAPSRITAVGMGESSPIGDNSTESGRSMNRRVEIDIFPTSDVQ